MPPGGARPGSGPKRTELTKRRKHLEDLWYDEVSDDDHREIIGQVRDQAKKGVQWAIVIYLERIQGKVAQPLEHSGDPEKPIHVRHGDRPSAGKPGA